MAKARQNRVHAPETGPARQGEVGRLLRETRESQRLDLRNVSDALRIRFAHLLAIEEGRYGDLPGATYAVGFVRGYAEHLHLDSAEVVRRFKDESSIESVNELAFPTPVNEGGVPSGALIVIALLLAGGVYGGWHLMSGSDRSVAEMIQDVPERLTALLPKRDDADPPAVVAAAAPETGAAEEAVSPQRFLDDATVANTLAAPAGPEAAMLPPGEAPVTDEPAVRAVNEAPSPSPTEPAVVMADEPPPPEDTAAVVPPEDVDPAVATAEAPAQGADTSAAADSANVASMATDRAVVAQSAPAAADPAPAPVTAPVPAAPAVREPVPAPMPTAADDRSAPPPPALQDAAVPATARVFGEENSNARVVLRARSDAWVQVRDGQGLLMTRLLKRGDVYRLPDRDGLTLMTGNAGGLIVEVDGTALPPLGRTGEVRRDFSLDISRLKPGAGGTN